MREGHIKTERLLFSHWREDDLELAAMLWGNHDVSRYITAAGVFTADEISARLALEIENERTLGVQYWPIFLREDGEFVGCCGLRPHGQDKSTLEIGVHLLPGYWGAGYAKEAISGAMGYAFNALGAKSLFAGHNPNNTASRGLILSLGFKYLGDELYPPTGLYHPSYIYEREGMA